LPVVGAMVHRCNTHIFSLVHYLKIQLAFRKGLDQAIQKDARLSALVHLLYSSGARIAEILALDLSDIDFTARKFQVIGKGNKQRWCFYNEDTDFYLNNYIKYYRHPQISALFTAQKPNQEYVSRLSYGTRPEK
jgi:integrase/recombinase XerD